MFSNLSNIASMIVTRAKWRKGAMMVAAFDADPQLDQALIQRSKKAAENWDSRRDIREKKTQALQEKRPLDADSPARLAMRMNRLVADVRMSSRDRRPPDNPM